MVRRKDDRPKAIGLRGGLGGLGFRTRRSTRARIVAGPEDDAWRTCATHRTPSDRAERHLVTRRRAQRFTMGFAGPQWCACERAGDVPAAVRSLVALSAVVEWPKAVDVFGCNRSNRSGLECFVPLPCGQRPEALHEPKAAVERWRRIATDDDFKIGARRHRVKQTFIAALIAG